MQSKKRTKARHNHEFNVKLLSKFLKFICASQKSKKFMRIFFIIFDWQVSIECRPRGPQRGKSESSGERRDLPRDHHPSQCPTIYWQLSRPPGRRFARFDYYSFYSAFAISCFKENLYTQRTVRTHMDDNLVCWLQSYISVNQSCICASVKDASSR